MVGLLGPSGSGKTTILRLIAGLERPTKGEIWIGGKRVTDLPPQKRNVGLVFQNYALFQHMTVYDNVAFGLKEKRVPRDEIDRRVRELLGYMRLTEYANRFPRELSGGQQQRVALARALAPRPQVLLFDEPFAAIDTQIRRELRKFVREVHDELGVTSLFVTHDQEEALEIADRVLVLHEGRVEQLGTPEEVYEQPETLFVASFIGESNVWRRPVQGGAVEVAGLRLPVDPAIPNGTPVAVVVRPKDVQLHPADREEGQGQILRSAFKGAYSACFVRTRDHEVWEVHVPSADRHLLSPGAWVRMDVHKFFVFPA